MKYLILVVTTGIIFAGCFSRKDVYEYEYVKQSEDTKQMEEIAPAPAAQPEDAKPAEEIAPVSAAQPEDAKPAEDIAPVSVAQPEDAKPAEKITPAQVTQFGSITSNDQNAKAAMDAALKALGGSDKIDGIKSLILKGKTTGVFTNEFELSILLPDNFVQINDQQGSNKPNVKRPQTMGISRGAMLPELYKAGPIQRNPDGTIILDDEDRADLKVRVNKLKDMWSFFLIGLLAKEGPTPLTISSGSKPGVYTLMTKNDSEAGEIEFDEETGYPSIVRYRLSPGQARYDVMRFEDRFSVNGIMFPRSVNVSSTAEWWISGSTRRIDEVLINPELTLTFFDELAAENNFYTRDLNFLQY